MEKIQEYIKATPDFYASDEMLDYVAIAYGVIGIVRFLYLLMNRNRLDNWYQTVFNGVFRSVFWGVEFWGAFISWLGSLGRVPKR